MSKNDQFQFGCDLFVCVFNNNNSTMFPQKTTNLTRLTMSVDTTQCQPRHNGQNNHSNNNNSRSSIDTWTTEFAELHNQTTAKAKQQMSRLNAVIHVLRNHWQFAVKLLLYVYIFLPFLCFFPWLSVYSTLRTYNNIW